MQPLIITHESLADQCSIAQQVFLTMADIEIAPVLDHVSTGPAIASVLHYSAPSEGTILLECTPALAYAFTARLMQIPIPERLDDDVRDAMGELANMIGGNLKGLMPEETCVSTPSVLAETGRQQLLQNSHRISRVTLAGPGGHLFISLLVRGHAELPSHTAK